MKICLLTTTFPRFRDDFMGQWLIGLSRALVEAGAQVTVVAPHHQDTKGYEVWDSVEIRRFHYWWPRRMHGLCYGAGIPTNVRRHRWLALQLPPLEAGFLLAALRYGRDADVLNAHWSFAGVPAVMASKLLGKPLVTTAYSAEYVPAALRPINRFIVRNSQAVFSISRYTYDQVEQVAQTPRHQVIAFGVNDEKIAPDDFDGARFRAEQGVAPHETLVFAVGRLVERKGYAVLIDAVARLVERGRPVKLLLAGKGPQAGELQERIDAQGLTGHARLLGFIPDAQLRYYLRAADVLAMPSIADKTGDTEGLGIPSLEGMANGTPVVASHIGGIVDIVTHEETGLLVEPGRADALADAIERLMDDPALRDRLIANGYALVGGPFSWRAIAQQALDLFAAVVADA